MGWKAGIGYELGRGTSRNAANSSACIGNSAQRELQIIYHSWQPPESIIRALLFSIPRTAIYRIHYKCANMLARRESPALPYH